MFSFLVVLVVTGQTKKYTTANGHAHNDYLNAHPFTTAYENGFGSIEVDIFPVNGKLLVAHEKRTIDSSRTIENLYLQPIYEKLKTGTMRNIRLLVDIKEDYKESLSILVRNLSPFVKDLSKPGEPGKIMIVISGRRPIPSEYHAYPSYIFFDDDLRHPHDATAWARIGLVSLQFSRFSTWKGEGPVKKEERERLQQVIDSVHIAGKQIRFWGAPDTLKSWECQVEWGADLIGTDKIEALSAYLRNRN